MNTAEVHNSGHQHSGNKKVIMKVFWILLVITVIEVLWGSQISSALPKWVNALFFISLTLIKAGYIVAEFMHLKHETKTFINCILIPLLIFVWFIIAFCFDGHFWLRDKIKHNYKVSVEASKKSVEHGHDATH